MTGVQTCALPIFPQAPFRVNHKAVPAMPYGSPGMGPEEKREAYDVFLVMNDGAAQVFQHYPQAGIPV